MSNITVVIGGSRSGKSLYAEKLASELGDKRVYLATAEVVDSEMEKRVENHRKQREGLFYKTVEEAIDVAKALSGIEDQNDIVLIDCIGTWLGNLVFHQGIKTSYDEVEKFFTYLENTKQQIVIVTNEVGQGLSPSDSLGRHYRDQCGFLNQRLAKIANKVFFVTAGIAQIIKG